jgi:Leucine-rich repeat (LRR) protein
MSEQLLLIPTLEVISLANNQIEEIMIGDEQINLPNLRVLNLSNNQLKVFPKEICELTTLQELCLDHNKLMRLPENMTKVCETNNLKL